MLELAVPCKPLASQYDTYADTIHSGPTSIVSVLKSAKELHSELFVA
jgi:hypothetical protein